MISGGSKFFKKSLCLAVDGSTATASSGNDASPYVLDQNPDTRWRSVGSSDAITETMEIDFPSAIDISRIFLLDHNLKDFTIKYDVAGVWTHFASVTGINGAKTNITETTFADDCSYYEFNSVNASKILITMNKTQLVDKQKYLNQVIVTNEIGTLVGYPTVKQLTIDKNAKVAKTISGKLVVQKTIETASFAFTFQRYPSESTYNVDMDLMMSLFDSQDPFLTWLCGGRRGSNYFRYQLRGWRLKDVFQTQVSKAINLSYDLGMYKAGINAVVQIDEHI